MLECSDLAYLFLPEVYYFLIDENELQDLYRSRRVFGGYDIMLHDAKKVTACEACAGYVRFRCGKF